MPERINEQFSADINNALKEYEQKRGVQVRYVSKIHPAAPFITSEDVTSRLEAIVERAKLQQVDYLFLDQFNKPLITRLNDNFEDRANLGIQESKQQVKRVRRKRRQEQRDYTEILTPSEDLAWMLGVLSAGGYAKLGMGTLSLSSRRTEFLEAYKEIGERLFRVNAFSDKRPNGITHIIRFSSKALISRLGDLRSANWPATIFERHSWVIDRQYVWRFLEGYLDKSGSIKYSAKQIEFLTKYENAKVFLTDMLVKVGIERPYIVHTGVVVGNLNETKRIAENVHLHSHNKEERLERFRNYQPHFQRPLNPTENDLIQEWKNLKRILGKTPTTYSIKKLKGRKQTRYHYKSYCLKFGSGSFVKASKYLESITSDN